MNLALSNIAYSDPFDPEIVSVMAEAGISLLEVAPLKTFGSIEKFDPAKVEVFMRFAESNKLVVTAFQALLFGAEELYIFDDESNRLRLKEILFSQIALAGELGVKNLVYGSPGTRKLFGKPAEEIFNTASDFFKELGDYSAEKSTSLSIEPNPPAYKNEFLQTTSECLNFVKSVGSPGLKAHIDTSTMIINRENPVELPEGIADFNAHIHISEPFLSPFGMEENSDFHRTFAKHLNETMPDKVVSLEIKQSEKPVLINSIREFAKIYGKRV